jgi:curved DNA-binding protein CbpA
MPLNNTNKKTTKKVKYNIQKGGYDIYKALGVKPNDTASEISKKYRKLALKYHPDKAGPNSNRSLWDYIKNANNIITDDELKRKYDTEIRNGKTAEYAYNVATDSHSQSASQSIMKDVSNTDYYKSLNSQSRQSQPTSQSQPPSQPISYRRQPQSHRRQPTSHRRQSQQADTKADANARAKAAEMREKEVQRKREEEINKAAKADAEQPFFEGSILDRTFYDGIDRDIRREDTIKLLKKFEEMYFNLYHMKEFIDNTLIPYYRDGNHEIDIDKKSYKTLNTIKMSLLDFYPFDILSMVEKGSVDYESFDLDGCIKQILLNFFDRNPKRTNDLDRCVFNIYNMIYLFEREIEKQDDYVGAGRRRYKNHSKRKINTKKNRTNKKNFKKTKVASKKKQKSKVASKKKQKIKKNNRIRHKSTLKR